MEKVKDKAIIILTAKSAKRIFKAGGTQSWVLDRTHARRCRFAVVCQNANADWGDGKEPHGKAFMVGLVDDVVPSTEKKGRWLVKFSDYTDIDIPDAWAGWRNPVRYTTLAALGIDPNKLKFRPMPPIADNNREKGIGGKRVKGMSIAEAKEALAETFGVAPEAVEITIRG